MIMKRNIIKISEQEESFLWDLKNKIEKVIEDYKKTETALEKKYLRATYKELTTSYHNHTGIEVWNKNLQ